MNEAGAISYLVRFLSKEREALNGEEVQLEVLHALHNICMYNKQVWAAVWG
jgi:hypothetical protein